jgi:hypothetical protein
MDEDGDDIDEEGDEQCPPVINPNQSLFDDAHLSSSYAAPTSSSLVEGMDKTQRMALTSKLSTDTQVSNKWAMLRNMITSLTLCSYGLQCLFE